jgi:hypothetical protein
MPHPGADMSIANHCRDRALLLMEVAKKIPRFETQAIALAQSWLTLADIDDRYGRRAEVSDRRAVAHDEAKTEAV